jgi:peptidoglycan hydrolase CwlO-like protein
MAAASNESQGLKIAVAAFIALSVILSVASYFLYSAYTSADAKYTSNMDELNKAKKAQSDILSQYEEMRQKIGTKATESDPAKEEIANHFKKINGQFDELVNAATAAIQKAQAAGAGQELQDVRDKIQQIVQSYRSEPSKTYISTLDRISELMQSLSLLSTELSLNYKDLRDKLEGATNVAKQQVDVQIKSAETSKADLDSEHKNHDAERQNLVNKVTEQQTDIDKKVTQIANLQADVKRLQDEYSHEKDQLTTIIRDLRDRAEKVDTILDHPDGYITFVDYERGEVQLNINRGMGARPQMAMSVFDANAPGIPTEKPKGTIELTKVGDQFSIARITKTVSPIDPLRTGDIIYTPAWSPNNPTRFALVGKMDVNRDGKDDREELKRMIQEAGGVVDFDLPPLEIGKETGKITPRIDWYVIDERMPFRDVYGERESEASLSRQTKLAQRVGEVQKECRLDGIRPMPIGRLLSFLGYDINTPVIGRAENVNDKAIRRLTAPRQKPNVLSPKPDATPKAEDADEMKDEKPKPKSKGQPAKKADDNEEAGDPK